MLQPAARRPKGEVRFGRIAVILFVAYFVIGCIGALQEAEEPFVQVFGFDLPTFIGSGFGIVLVVCFIFFSLKIDFASLFRWLAPLVVLSLALFPWQDVLPSFVSSTIMAIADTCLQAVSYLYVIALAKRRFISVAVGIGTSQGALQLGVLAGNLAGEAASPLVASGSLNVFVVVLALICLFSFSLALLPARGGKAPMRAAGGGSEPAESAFAATCRQLAAANRPVRTRGRGTRIPGEGPFAALHPRGAAAFEEHGGHAREAHLPEARRAFASRVAGPVRDERLAGRGEPLARRRQAAPSR